MTSNSSETRAVGRSLHWRLGMYASGSTWAFNVTRAIVAAVEPDRDVRTRFVDAVIDLRSAPSLSEADCAIVKSHQSDREAEAWLAERATSLVITVRDPRDAVASVMRHQRQDFARALASVAASARSCLAFASDPKALLLRYEERFTEDPAAPARIARAMGLDLDLARSAEIVRAHQRTHIETALQGAIRDGRALATADRSDFLDPLTHWHNHHLGRDGRSGVWTDWLSRNQIEAVEKETAEAMRAWGYSRSSAGAASRVERVHVINLDRATDRLAQFRERHPDLAVVRVAATEGATLDWAECVRAGLITAGTSYRPGALGCALSHIALWRQCAAGADIFHIAEDDVVLRRDFATQAASVLAALTDWDVVVWGVNQDWPVQVMLAPGLDVAVLQYDHETFREATFRAAVTPITAWRLVSCTGTLCYSISPGGAARMLADCLPLGEAPARYLAKLEVSLANNGLDIEMTRHYASWRAYVAVPPLAASENDQRRSSIRGHLASMHDIAKANRAP